MGSLKNTNSDTFRKIEKMFVEEKLPATVITSRMDGRVTHLTVRRYIAIILNRAKERGEPIDVRQLDLEAMKAENNKRMGELHDRVGSRILQHRMGDDVRYSPKDYADKFGIGNQISITKMEHGKYDFTLSELERIAVAIGCSVPELLTANWERARSAKS